jgi:hypothetical protein
MIYLIYSSPLESIMKTTASLCKRKQVQRRVSGQVERLSNFVLFLTVFLRLWGGVLLNCVFGTSGASWPGFHFCVPLVRPAFEHKLSAWKFQDILAASRWLLCCFSLRGFQSFFHELMKIGVYLPVATSNYGPLVGPGRNTRRCCRASCFQLLKYLMILVIFLTKTS